LVAAAFLAASAPHLGEVLDNLHRRDLLWTPYGLRSLAKNSTLYNKRNTEVALDIQGYLSNR